MARLCERVEPGGGQRQGIETKGVGGVSLGLRDRLAAGPCLRRASPRGRAGANLAITIEHSRPHPLAVKEPSGVAAILWRLGEKIPQLLFTRYILASGLFITSL